MPRGKRTLEPLASLDSKRFLGQPAVYEARRVRQAGPVHANGIIPIGPTIDYRAPHDRGPLRAGQLIPAARISDGYCQ
jgi:hypothetical protein